MPKVAPAMHSILRAIMRILLLLLSVMIALNIIGVPISSFLAVFSVIGLALSLAVQGVLKNFAGGMIILASKPFSLATTLRRRPWPAPWRKSASFTPA